jgi:NitT/TauT family transport system substrate-binding protein
VVETMSSGDPSHRRQLSERMGKRRFVAAASMAVVLAGALAACSSAGSSSGSDAAAAKSEPTVTIALAATGSPFAPVYVAQAQGYFSKLGVNVNVINNAASTGVALMASGKADLMAVGPGPVFSLNQQGKHTEIIYNIYSGGAGAVEVATESKAKSLADLSGERVGTLGIGGSSYGYAAVYSQYVSAHGGKPFTIVPYGTQGLLINAVLTGQVAAAVDSASWFASEISAGKAHLLVNTSSAGWAQTYNIPAGVSDGAIFGLSSNLSSKRDAIVKFLEGVSEGTQYVDSHTPGEIAATMKKLDAFSTETLQEVTADVTDNQHFVGVDQGKINSSTWAEQLKIYALWGMKGVNVTESEFPYSQLVDMSYLNQALSDLGSS